MKWIAKDPPIYVWENDEWLNERDRKIYRAIIPGNIWRTLSGDFIHFPARTKIFRNKNIYELTKDGMFLLIERTTKLPCK